MRLAGSRCQPRAVRSWRHGPETFSDEEILLYCKGWKPFGGVVALWSLVLVSNFFRIPGGGMEFPFERCYRPSWHPEGGSCWHSHNALLASSKHLPSWNS